jgi:hypothetical protein
MVVRSHLPSEAGELGWINPDTGIFIESRFHRTVESEANLTGVVTTDTGIMTSAPYKVLDADHWVFENTGLANGDLFGKESLHERVMGGASGHETDKISPSSPKNLIHLAKGTNIDDGGADLIIYDTPSGGRVFSVGSITWVAGLFPDPYVPIITRNVLVNFLTT